MSLRMFLAFCISLSMLGCANHRISNAAEIPAMFHGGYMHDSKDFIMYIIGDNYILPVMFPEACFNVKAVTINAINSASIMVATSNSPDGVPSQVDLVIDGDSLDMTLKGSGDDKRVLVIALKRVSTAQDAFKSLGHAQQGDAPEPATHASPASRTPLAPAR